MARIAIVFGMLLCGLTLAALCLSTQKMPAQFCPMMFGIPLLFAGVVGLNPHRRKHAMHAAAAVAMVGTIGGGANALVSTVRHFTGIATNPLGLQTIIVMTSLCLIYLLISIYSFLTVRRKKRLASSA